MKLPLEPQKAFHIHSLVALPWSQGEEQKLLNGLKEKYLLLQCLFDIFFTLLVFSSFLLLLQIFPLLFFVYCLIEDLVMLVSSLMCFIYFVLFLQPTSHLSLFSSSLFVFLMCIIPCHFLLIHRPLTIDLKSSKSPNNKIVLFSQGLFLLWIACSTAITCS